MSESGAQQQVARLRAELAEARAALGDFAYVVSHDLRAQARHVKAYAGLLRESLGPALQGEAGQFLATVETAAALMGRQIDGLMAWAQLDRAELDPMPLETKALLAEARQALAAQESGRHIEWTMAPDLPRVRGDGALLRQLFVHLLDNALKFTRPREAAQITVTWAPAQPGWVTLHLRDNGVGYNPAQQAQLFHVFQRLHPATQFEGLGLGLALARKIVERHGGSIAIEGAPDAGCCVSVTLQTA